MNNDSARGYFILTLKSLGYKEEEIERIVDQALGLYFKNITKVNWM